MKFTNAELRPGIVKQVVDTIGTVRADVYGLFTSSDAEEIGFLPPIKPLMMLGNRGSFSAPKIDDKIWVLSSNVDSRILYYIPYYDIEHMISLIDAGSKPDGTLNIDAESEDTKEIVEVLLNVDDDGKPVQILYNKEDQLIIWNNVSYIKLLDGEIEICGEEGNSVINITKDKVILGKNDQKILNGDDTVDSLNDIVSEIDALYSIFMSILPTMVGSASPATVMGLSSVSSQIPNVAKGKANIAKIKTALKQIQSNTVYAQT